MVKRHLGLYVELGKVRIAALATTTMVAGYLLGPAATPLPLVALALGVFVLACGASALNQAQERDIDALMRRTMSRPLPTNRATICYACLVAAASVLAGIAIILAVGGATPALLGLVTVFWYNAVYTPLKRVTAFAAVPGGVVGAIPPVIGWTAAGGAVFDPQILAVAFFFFIWQVPHFWLLLLFSVGSDYERAGLPSLTKLFSPDQIARITFVWIFATAVACLLIPLFGIVSVPWINVGLGLSGLWLVWRSSQILRRPGGSFTFRLAFKQINVYVCWVLSLLAVNGIFG